MIKKWTACVCVDLTCCRPEQPPYLIPGPGSWPDWWNLRGWRPIGRSGGCCPTNRTRPHKACTTECSSLKTCQLGRRKLKEEKRAVMQRANMQRHARAGGTYSSLFLCWEVGGLNRSLDSEEWRPSIESPCCHTLCTGSSNLSAWHTKYTHVKYPLFANP